MDRREDGTGDAAASAGAERVKFSVTVEDGETVITMDGDRDTAVIVRSVTGERIYLPPEDFEREAGGRDDSSYQPAHDESPYRGSSDTPVRGAESASPYRGVESDSPYRGIESDSPYQAARESLPSEGMISTADGYRIRHPEPVTDVRVLR
ncbi:DUF7510 family protein [Halobellus marinus]|uniref:DUF7510 family protein n=1 Tax=Halobellus TaxID=1073986 RepID=UPI0028A8E692|nr:hypothetical protein [Halobellus sp. DFY28]